MNSRLVVGMAVLLAGCAVQPSPTQAPAPELAPIQDNSFLVEEAYNQEPGVVQHISTFESDRRSALWVYGFTQEWPLRSQSHQLSYTIRYGRFVEGDRAGTGDVLLNYRREIPNSDRSLVAAPRLSVLLPTGSVERGSGVGGTGVEAAVPVSWVITPRLVAHFNAIAGITYTRQRIPGDPSRTRKLGAAQSFIWLARHNVNLMFETVWAREDMFVAPNDRAHETSLVISPGVRWAWTFPSGLQVVPGIAFPTGVGASSGERSFFLYLSLEHSFASPARVVAERPR